MNSQRWLAVQSFEENQKLLSAINTLSIHTKLEFAGHPDEERAEASEKAKDELSLFLKELEPIVQRAEDVGKRPLLGVNRRRGEFVRSFVDAKQNYYQCRSTLFREKLSCIAEQLYSDVEVDRQAILLVLDDLRTLLEEHLAHDVAQLFGGF